MKKILKILLILIMLSISDLFAMDGNKSAYSKNEFLYSPYVDVSLYPFPLLSDISKNNNVFNYTLGFIVSKNTTCEGSWGGYYDIDKGPSAWINGTEKFLYNELKYIKSQGGKIMLSFGGSEGTMLFKTCNNELDLLKQYSYIIDRIGTKYLDYDIEGQILADNKSIDRLVSTLLKLQKLYNNDLHIWFTLPVMPEGLDKNALNLVNKVKKAGLKFDGINLMTMDYGENYNKNMGFYTMESVKNTQKQIGNIKLGITPMIGLNDIKSETFTLDDAKNVSNFAIKNNYVSRLSYWNINRDHSCKNNNIELKCTSNNNQSIDWEYLKTFKINNKIKRESYILSEKEKLLNRIKILEIRLKKNARFSKILSKLQILIPKISNNKILEIDQRIAKFSTKIRGNQKYKDILDYLEVRIKLEIIKRNIN